MNEFEAYQYYMALKLHFESDAYNAPQYNYKTRANPKSFWKRNDKYFFGKLARRFQKAPDLVDFYTAHFVNDKKYVAEMLSDEMTYVKWQRTMQSITRVFTNDVDKLAQYNFDDLLTTEGGHPKIVTMWLQDEICLETVVIIEKLTGFTHRCDKKINETILWPDISRKIKKYGLLMRIDLEKMRKIILNSFEKTVDS